MVRVIDADALCAALGNGLYEQSVSINERCPWCGMPMTLCVDAYSDGTVTGAYYKCVVCKRVVVSRGVTENGGQNEQG